MGTGIVSIALSLDRYKTSSRLLLAVMAVVWVMLGFLLPARALRDPARLRVDRRMSAAFTAVAGTAVLGARHTMLGWTCTGEALIVVALGLYLA